MAVTRANEEIRKLGSFGIADSFITLIHPRPSSHCTWGCYQFINSMSISG